MYPSEGEFEEVYSSSARVSLVDDDGMSIQEEAFMNGYDDLSSDASEESDADKAYESAFGRRSRRSKRQQVSFDDEELESEVIMR